MTVRELVEKLQKIENQEADLYFLANTRIDIFGETVQENGFDIWESTEKNEVVIEYEF